MLIPVFITDGAIIVFVCRASQLQLKHTCPLQCYQFASQPSRTWSICAHETKAHKETEWNHKFHVVSSYPFMDTTYYSHCTSMVSKQSHFHVICKWHETIQVTHLPLSKRTDFPQHIIIISPLCRIAECRHALRSLWSAFFPLILYCFALFFFFGKARQNSPNHIYAVRNRPDRNQFKAMNCHQKCIRFFSHSHPDYSLQIHSMGNIQF